MRGQRLITYPIKKGIRIIDTESKELKYIKLKYPNYYDIININTRNSFSAGSTLLAMIKCSYGFNQYATRDKIINYGLAIEECPRSS